MNSRAPFPSRLPLFADVSAETLARLEHRMRRREFAPRAVIVREGDADDSAFLVLSGRVALRRKDQDSGIEFLLAELGEGEMFGGCGIIEQSDFVQLLAEHPAAVRAMMAALADRLEAAKQAAATSVDLLESDLIRELQLAADTEDEKTETSVVSVDI